MDLLGAVGEPDSRVNAVSEFSDNLVLAVVEDISNSDWVVTPTPVTTETLFGNDA